MQLEAYLTAAEISEADFAHLIGVDRSSVNRMRRGKQTPSAEVMRVIAEKTNGKVTANDFFGIAA
jgi:DNA-binding transcriptional regulator YdaS (Cro superfamily)